MLEENLIERPKLHRKAKKRHYGAADKFCGSDRSGGMRRPTIKISVYATDKDCIEDGGISLSPALFES